MLNTIITALFMVANALWINRWIRYRASRRQRIAAGLRQWITKEGEL
jgi:hypothetical protein